MTERSEYVLETLRKGEEFALYRGRRHGNPLPVLADARRRTAARLRASGGSSTNTRSRPTSIPAWAARPLALDSARRAAHARAQGPWRRAARPAARATDGGDTLLAPRDRLAAALGRLHRRGLIHKDIKPANILVEPRDRRGHGSPASASPRACRASARRPRRPRSSPARSPTWRPSRPAG